MRKASILILVLVAGTFLINFSVLKVKATSNPIKFTISADFNGWNFSVSPNPGMFQFRGVAFTANIVWVNSVHDFAVYTKGFPAGSVSTSNTCSTTNTNGCLAASAFVSSGTVSFSFTPTIPADDFTGAGTYEYYCQIHPFSMHGQITVLKSPDLDNDGQVDIGDLGAIAFAYKTTPTSPNWNAAADLDNNGIIDISDLSIDAFYYHLPI